MNLPEYVEKIAMICHTANRAYCESIGDDSQPPWFDAPEWQKESAIAGVLAIMDSPGMTPEQSHESWMKQKIDDGWKWGPVKNPDLMEHPCIVPYEELPEDQKKKDRIFTSIVKAMI